MKLKHLLALTDRSSISQPYHQISSLEQLEDDINEQTLVIFDIDEVLITTEDHFLHPYAEKFFLSQIQEAINRVKNPIEKAQFEESLSLSVLLPKRNLIESNAPNIINNMQSKGIKVIALTTWPTGAFGLIPKLEKWRIEHLQLLKFNFAHSFSELTYFDFKELQDDEEKYLPLYEDGILFSPGYKKGDILTEFLKKIKWRPSRVIFIDDLVENLESVGHALESMGISYKGYQYLGAQRFFKPVNEKVLRYQFSHLIDMKEWLNDQEVIKRLGYDVRPFETLTSLDKGFYRASPYQPYHLSVGAVLFDQQGRIACHHFKEILGYKDIYILMRETMEANETPIMTLSRGLMEEFAASAEPVAFLGVLSGPSVELGLAYNKTTLYFACQLMNWNSKQRNLQDTEGSSIIEWIEPEQLITIMANQGARFQRVDADESEIIKRALPYITDDKIKV